MGSFFSFKLHKHDFHQFKSDFLLDYSDGAPKEKQKSY